MRHRVAGGKLGRTSSHRIATLRNLAQNLIEHGQIRTTFYKAREARPFVERLITLAKKARDGDLPARRRITQLLNDRAVIPADHLEAYEEMSDARRAKVLRARSGRRHRTGEARPGTTFTAESVVRRLIETVAADFADRPGGYTRIIKLADSRSGDASPLAVLQLVGKESDPGSVTRAGTSARQRRTQARYEMVERGSPRKKRAAAAAKTARRAETPAEPTEAAKELEAAPTEDSGGAQPTSE
jgi:large subunit ribosomal protein L17